MARKDIPFLRVMLAFLIATFMMLAGFLIGYSVSYIKYQQISQNQEDVIYNLMSIDLEKQLVETCDISLYSTLPAELDSMGKSIMILEQRFEKNNEKVLTQKNRYTLLEVKHFLYIKEYSKMCSSKMHTILFFYSNTEEYRKSAERTGGILDKIKEKYNESVMIYSFDYDLNNNIIKILKNMYNITGTNTILIDEKYQITKLPTLEDIEKYL